MTEVTIKVGDHSRNVIGTTIGFVSFEFYMYDKELGKRNFIQFINMECKTSNDLEKQVEEYLEDFEEIFSKLKGDKKWFRDKETEPIDAPIEIKH